MSARTELIKLEAMYYHQREARHIEFLKTHELYAWFRNINTFKGGKLIIDTENVKSTGSSFNRGKTIPETERKSRD